MYLLGSVETVFNITLVFMTITYDHNEKTSPPSVQQQSLNLKSAYERTSKKPDLPHVIFHRRNYPWIKRAQLSSATSSLSGNRWRMEESCTKLCPEKQLCVHSISPTEQLPTFCVGFDELLLSDFFCGLDSDSRLILLQGVPSDCSPVPPEDVFTFVPKAFYLKYETRLPERQSETFENNPEEYRSEYKAEFLTNSENGRHPIFLIVITTFGLSKII